MVVGVSRGITGCEVSGFRVLGLAGLGYRAMEKVGRPRNGLIRCFRVLTLYTYKDEDEMFRVSGLQGCGRAILRRRGESHTASRVK